MDRGRQQSPGLAPRHDASSRIQKPESAAERMAALRARVAAAVGNKPKSGLNTPLHPALADLKGGQGGGGGGGGLNTPLHPALTDLKVGLGGLKTPLHPALAGLNGPGRAAETLRMNETQRPIPDGAKSSYHNKKKPMSFSATGPDGSRTNPYLESGPAPAGKAREPRQLVFNQKGKYIHQANALRKQAALEEMKKRIADTARKAGLDEDRDVEKAFAPDAPPDLEWWDEGLVDGKDYSNTPQSLKLETDDSIVTIFIQNPVAIEPPQDKLAPVPKPMYLTPKEQQKLRRQRRMMELKEKQAKIRLGLEPAPPPKVKKSNLMRVLGEEAVKDPTAVEARVNREIAERFDKHMQENEERKLTKEQRHEKLAANQAKDAAKGIHILVFKISSLVNGQHRYKVSVNATQNGLNGICIMHPKFSLVIVEGGEHGIEFYKKLMLRRINWTETLPTRDKDLAPGSTVPDWLKAEDEHGQLKDQSANKCVLLFEGETKAYAFRKWGSKICETDQEARAVLAPRKMDTFWTQAKNTQ
ncbi:pre-mRNA processing factor 3-domain-containing protein [Podospora didyma]|uniref:Pre-mRNA processing factor 3-domain-containing protein n=1 Tax=Podospora didyma TaxID=330526 RepID=A0AAE0NSM3_9PEZI|nr:pre-mRNA processing factor 3-domain-containing protein [Podospora didyma]